MMPHSWRHFLTFWRILMPKSSIFGAPGRSARCQMAPKIAQVAPKCLTILSYALALLVTYFQGHFRSAPCHHFGRFRHPHGSKIFDFRTIFRHTLIRFLVFFFSFWDAISSKIVDFPHDVLHIFVLRIQAYPGISWHILAYPGKICQESARNLPRIS